MSWSPGVGVAATIALDVGHNESVALRLSRDSGAYLTIGDGVEITLAQSHVAALHEQSAAVLGDMIALDTAEDQVVTANAVGDRAATTAEYAWKQADAAMAVGATQEARDARVAADKAADAAVLVQTAVLAALDAMETAEEAMEAAGEAAAASALAVEAATASALADDSPATDPRLVVGISHDKSHLSRELPTTSAASARERHAHPH